MPRLKFDLAFCLLALAAPGFAKDGGQAVAPPPPAADPCAQDPCKTAQAMFPVPLERETFLALLAQDPKMSSDFNALIAGAAQQETASAGAGIAALKDAVTKIYGPQVNSALGKTQSVLKAGLNRNPPWDTVDKYSAANPPNSVSWPLVGALVADKSLGLKDVRDLFKSVDVQKYGGGATPPPAKIPPCPDGTVRSQKSLDMLKAVAANGGDMTAALGDHGQCDPVTPPKTDPKTDPTNVQTPPTTASVPVKDSQSNAPPAPGKDSSDSGGGFMSGIKNFFGGLPVNQMLAGVGFGAAMGMLFGFGTPVGMIGGALIGGLLGAVLGSGVIGKLFGGGGSGGS